MRNKYGRFDLRTSSPFQGILNSLNNTCAYNTRFGAGKVSFNFQVFFFLQNLSEISFQNFACFFFERFPCKVCFISSKISGQIEGLNLFLTVGLWTVCCLIKWAIGAPHIEALESRGKTQMNVLTQALLSNMSFSLIKLQSYRDSIPQ